MKLEKTRSTGNLHPPPPCQDVTLALQVGFTLRVREILRIPERKVSFFGPPIGVAKLKSLTGALLVNRRAMQPYLTPAFPLAPHQRSIDGNNTDLDSSHSILD